MLAIKLNLDIKRSISSPSLRFISLIGISNGSCFDCIRLVDHSKPFYLFLPGVYNNKPADAIGSLLPPEDSTNPGWDRAYEVCLSQPLRQLKQKKFSNRLNGTKSETDECVLRIMTYEVLSTPAPQPSEGTFVHNQTNVYPSSGDSSSESSTAKPLGEMEEYLLSHTKGDKDGNLALKEINIGALSTIRVGQASVSMNILALAYLELLKQNKGETKRTVAQLLDVSVIPAVRGKVELVCYLDEMCPPPNRTWLNLVNDIQIGGYSPLSAGSYKMHYDQFIRYYRTDFYDQYLEQFPDRRPGDPGAMPSVANDPGTLHENRTQFTVSSTSSVVPPQFNTDGVKISANVTKKIHIRCQRLRASIDQARTVHAPLAYVDGDIPMLSGQLYTNPIKNEFIQRDLHQRYIGSVVDTICILFGTTSVELANTIHMCLDEANSNTADSGVQYTHPKLLAALRIMGFIYTHLALTYRYRIDYVLGKANGRGDEENVIVREDRSRDILLGLNSQDCDGEDIPTMALMHIIWTGIVGDKSISKTQRSQNDSLRKSLEMYFGKSKVQPGAWEHPGLDALQRLSLYYMPITCMGKTASSYPKNSDNGKASESANSENEDTKTSISSEINIFVHDMDDLDSLINDKQEVNKLFVKSNDMENMITHRFAIGLPIQVVTGAIRKGIMLEYQKSSQSTRFREDAELCRNVMQLHNHLEQIRERLPRLPPLILDGTVPTNPMAIIGASNYIDPKLALSDSIREIEATNRYLAMKIRKTDEAKDLLPGSEEWIPRGVVGIEEGVCQYLPGNTKDRRTSLFYKTICVGDIPLLNTLFETTDFYCSFITPDGDAFGVDIEDVFDLDVGQSGKNTKFALTLPLHRVSYSLREGLKTQGEYVLKRHIPAQFCAYSSGNIELPTENGTFIKVKSELLDQRSTPMSSTFDAEYIFKTTLLGVNADIISVEDAKILEERIKNVAHDITKVREKLQPFGPHVVLYSYTRM